jgi:phosphatidylglycerol:prolipoprotein diacylglycerol transferase
MLQVIWRIPILKNQFPDGVPIYGFGLMLFFAFILCTWLGGRRAEREGIKKETIQDLALWIFLGGILGARILYLYDENPRLLSRNPLEFLMRLPRIWDGGIILYGAVVGGALGYAAAYFLIFRKQGLSTLRLADVIAPSIAIGLCLGRTGCFLNGCCYGQVACSECAVCPVHFPLSAPSRDILVRKGVQTAAGFTLAVPQPTTNKGVLVGQIDPASPAGRAGLKAGSVIVELNGHSLRGFRLTSDSFSFLRGLRVPVSDTVLAKLQPLKDREFDTREDLEQELTQILDKDEAQQFQQPVVNSAVDGLSYMNTLLALGPDSDNWPRGRWRLEMAFEPQPGEAVETATIIPRTLGLYPTQLYEVVSMFLLFLVLLSYEPFRRNPGQVMAILMVGYGIHRSLNELLRDDPRPISLELLGSAVLIVSGVVLWTILSRLAPAPPVKAVGDAAKPTAAPIPA